MKGYNRIIFENADEFLIDLKQQALISTRNPKTRLRFADMNCNGEEEDCLSFRYDVQKKEIFQEFDESNPRDYLSISIPIAVLESRGIDLSAQHRWNSMAKENGWNFRVSYSAPKRIKQSR